LGRGRNAGSLFLNFYRDFGYIFSHDLDLHIADNCGLAVINRAKKQLPLAKKIFLFFLIRIKANHRARNLNVTVVAELYRNAAGLMPAWLSATFEG
jgi:hypothetical protein